MSEEPQTPDPSFSASPSEEDASAFSFDDPGAFDDADDPFGTDAPGASGDMGARGQVGMALSMARVWVKEHQEAVMLGAFAAGVAVGALLRD
jgi:hypothetical protein